MKKQTVEQLIQEFKKIADKEKGEIMEDQRPDTYAHILRVAQLLTKITKELQDRILGHDASKLEEPERSLFDEFTPKLRGMTYGSDEYKSCLKELKVALDHHYAHNRHHPEYHKNGIQSMTLVDLIEMLMDWKAATERHEDGDIRRSIELNQERFGYTDELKQILLNTIEALEK